MKPDKKVPSITVSIRKLQKEIDRLMVDVEGVKLTKANRLSLMEVKKGLQDLVKEVSPENIKLNQRMDKIILTLSHINARLYDVEKLVYGENFMASKDQQSMERH